MKEIDDTPVPENESEVTRELDIVPLERLTRQLVDRIEELELRIAELEVSRAVMRQKLEDQDEEWY